MKKSVSKKITKIEFFLYYATMALLSAFMCYNALKSGINFIILTILSGACVILSLIILISYFTQIRIVRYLLSVYLILLVILFISSAVIEIAFLGINLFPFVMKTILYGFCCAICLKHLLVLSEKLSLLEEYKDDNN